MEKLIVVAPYIEGNHDLKGIIELNYFENKLYKFKTTIALEDDGVHLKFEKINKKKVGKNYGRKVKFK